MCMWLVLCVHEQYYMVTGEQVPVMDAWLDFQRSTGGLSGRLPAVTKCCKGVQRTSQRLATVAMAAAGGCEPSSHGGPLLCWWHLGPAPRTLQIRCWCQGQGAHVATQQSDMLLVPVMIYGVGFDNDKFRSRVAALRVCLASSPAAVSRLSRVCAMCVCVCFGVSGKLLTAWADRHTLSHVCILL
jgi:hypothetical protein